MVLGGGKAAMNTKLTLGLFPGNLRPVHGMPIAAANMPDDICSSRIFIAMLHLYGTRGDTKIWAKIISYPSTNCCT